jgi:methylthioribose-1-phosphate isomerase
MTGFSNVSKSQANMKVNGQHYRTVWMDEQDASCVMIIDQRQLPHRFVVEEIRTVTEMATAIKDMHLRGAGLIGAAAGFGIYLAAVTTGKDDDIQKVIHAAGVQLMATRPTAVNLAWAVHRQWEVLQSENNREAIIQKAQETAQLIADEDAAACAAIGLAGLPQIEALSSQKNGQPVNILTHCNAGWLAFVDHGSALAPVYAAHDKGIDVHVWVDETRPRNQGASLTAWELNMHGVPHTIIADNTGGHLMQHGMVDLVIVGTDRTTVTGDVANKIGTYLKALAAKDNGVPFYVALPSSSFDWKIEDGCQEIEIEERDPDEVKFMEGLCDGEIKKISLTPEGSPALNIGFDVTPARLITGLITERGICRADKKSILQLFPERQTNG